eukprot:scaffold38150_cov65-Phaeocystis_antarctica.AAC.22
MRGHHGTPRSVVIEACLLEHPLDARALVDSVVAQIERQLGTRGGGKAVGLGHDLHQSLARSERADGIVPDAALLRPHERAHAHDLTLVVEQGAAAHASGERSVGHHVWWVGLRAAALAVRLLRLFHQKVGDARDDAERHRGTNVAGVADGDGELAQRGCRRCELERRERGCCRRWDPQHRKVETVRAASDHSRLVLGFERVRGKRDFHAHAALQAVRRGQDKRLVAVPHGDP